MSAEMKALGAPPIIETFAINPVGDGDICVDRGNRFAHERDVAKLHAWAKEAADAIERLARELDEARAVIAAADKGSPIYKAVERVLDEHSAWISRPSHKVTQAVALAAGVAWMSAEKIDPNLEEIDRALAAARAENDRLREALRPFAREAQFWDHAPDDVRLGVSCVDGFVDSGDAMFFPGHFRRARAALEQGGGNGE